MPIRVKIGNTDELAEFPDGTDDKTIESALSHYKEDSAKSATPEKPKRLLDQIKDIAGNTLAARTLGTVKKSLTSDESPLVQASYGAQDTRDVLGRLGGMKINTKYPEPETLEGKFGKVFGQFAGDPMEGLAAVIERSIPALASSPIGARAIASTENAIKPVAEGAKDFAQKIGAFLTKKSPDTFKDSLYNYKEAIARQFAGKSVFQKGWQESGRAFKEGEDALKAYKTLEQAANKGVGSERLNLIKNAKTKNIDNDSLLEKIQEVLGEYNFSDESGKGSYLSSEGRNFINQAVDDLTSKLKYTDKSGNKLGKEAVSTLMDPNYKDNLLFHTENYYKGKPLLQDQLQGLSDYAANAGKSLEDYGVQQKIIGATDKAGNKITPKQLEMLDAGISPMDLHGITEEKLPVSAARAHSRIGKLDKEIDYGPAHAASKYGGYDQSAFGQIRDFINDHVRKASNELGEANDISSAIKTMKSSLNNNLSDKSLTNLIDNFHKGNLNDRESSALKMLDKLSPTPFLESGEAQNIANHFKGWKSDEATPRFMQGAAFLPQLFTHPILGAAEAAAIGAATSPRMHAGLIQSLPGISNFAGKAASGIGTGLKTIAPALMARSLPRQDDGTLTPNVYDEYSKRKVVR